MTMTPISLATRVHDGAVADDDEPAAGPRRRASTAEYSSHIVELNRPGIGGGSIPWK